LSHPPCLQRMCVCIHQGCLFPTAGFECTGTSQRHDNLVAVSRGFTVFNAPFKQLLLAEIIENRSGCRGSGC
jgi:hypothetical protein